ncbi:MAG: cell division topological specificity factor MinE [Anaerolineae bacterium]
MGFFRRLFSAPEPSSSTVAKERLQVVLTTDRSNISPALLETLKDDIVSSISQHVEIDRAGIKISLSSERSYQRLVADIPVIRAREAGDTRGRNAAQPRPGKSSGSTRPARQ